MPGKIEDFTNYVEHPRYGRGPIFTNLIPSLSKRDEFVLIGRAGSCRSRINGTAVIADMEKQSGCAYAVKYYFDEKKCCPGCNRPFIFFAQQQKYWFDELGFNISTAGKWCYDCRQLRIGLKRNLLRYAELKNNDNRNIAESIEMAEICLTELEAGRFTERQTQTVRALLNVLSKHSNGDYENLDTSIEQIRNRLRLIDG